MKAEDLIRIAAPAGVDLVAAAKIAAPSRVRDVKIERRSWGTSTVLMQPARNRARGTSSRSIERPAWSLQELGQAAAGVPDVPFRAACYVWAGDTAQFARLHSALTAEAEQLRQQHAWPALMRDLHQLSVPYLPHLAKLVLDEDRSPSAFQAAPALYAVYMRITERTWETAIRERFEALKLSWLEWLGIAARIMQPRLREVDDY